MLLDLVMHRPQALAVALRGTPGWVWLLLAALVAWGLSQLRPRSVGLGRSVALPLAMAGLGAWGVVSVGRAGGMVWLPLAVWLAMAAATGGLLRWLRPDAPAGTRYERAARRFHLPGSTAPLLLILALFGLKYAVGLETALSARHGAGFVLAVAAAYGVGTGCFLARAMRLWSLALAATGRSGAAAWRDMRSIVQR